MHGQLDSTTLTLQPNVIHEMRQETTSKSGGRSLQALPKNQI
jgi:hypothetical protein